MASQPRVLLGEILFAGIIRIVVRNGAYPQNFVCAQPLLGFSQFDSNSNMAANWNAGSDQIIRAFGADKL